MKKKEWLNGTPIEYLREDSRKILVVPGKPKAIVINVTQDGQIEIEEIDNPLWEQSLDHIGNE